MWSWRRRTCGISLSRVGSSRAVPLAENVKIGLWLYFAAIIGRGTNLLNPLDVQYSHIIPILFIVKLY